MGNPAFLVILIIYLLGVDALLISQKVCLFEFILIFDKNFMFAFQDSTGHLSTSKNIIFQAEEKLIL